MAELPSEIDNATAIFSYGSLLDHGQLRTLLKAKREFEITETSDIADAVRLIGERPADVVILRDVRLGNVRVSVVTEAILRRWYKDSGGDLRKLIDAGVTTFETPEAAYLYARPAREGERGRSLNGGLICNLTAEEVAVLDKYEFETVLVRTRTPRLEIQGNIFSPAFISFYAGTQNTDDLSAAEKAERSRLLHLNRKPGRQGPHAKWPENVRRR